MIIPNLNIKHLILIMHSEIIHYYKWNDKKYKELFNSFRKLINIKSLQFYMPLFSLYFYIHNKPNATKKIDKGRSFGRCDSECFTLPLDENVPTQSFEKIIASS